MCPLSPEFEDQPIRMTLSPTLRSRFRGCLVGAVVGDCIGAPFEVTGVGGPGSYDNVQDFVNKFDVEIDGPGSVLLLITISYWIIIYNCHGLRTSCVLADYSLKNANIYLIL